jgi:UrcA family protein
MQNFAAAAALAVVTSAGIPSLAQALAPSDVRSKTVRFDDLNLATQSGVQALYLRILHAVRDVCGPAEFPGSRAAAAVWTDCVSTSVHQAILKINQPPLTVYYADRLRSPALRITG